MPYPTSSRQAAEAGDRRGISSTGEGSQHGTSLIPQEALSSSCQFAWSF